MTLINTMFSSKRKIFNDPVYGFITIPNRIVFDIIEHPKFQRLRRIKQLGLTHLIYPGALHTRFHHSMGAMFLMNEAIQVLRSKNIDISDQEAEGAMIAILMHDIGHGPYSHTLEHSIVSEINHEELSMLFIQCLNEEFEGKFDTAIEIFNNTYSKKVLHQLIHSQLDTDRLDYLKRDSFYTGVSEGIINADRIIKMLDVFDDDLVVEAKGIYSIEKFIIARRLMYWQVYLHKTVIAAEYLLRKILTRAKYLSRKGKDIFATPPFLHFLKNDFTKIDFDNNPELLDLFSQLDDFDIFTSLKIWTKSDDNVLSSLSQKLINRKLPKIEISNSTFEESYIEKIKNKTKDKYNLGNEELKYFVYTDTTSNYTFDPDSGSIKIKHKDGRILDISEASDQLNISVLSNPVTKHFLCYPKEVYYDLKK